MFIKRLMLCDYLRELFLATSPLAIVDYTENYGRHILKRVARQIKVSKCIDLGCGNGDDLSIVKQNHPAAELYGIDFGSWNKKKLETLGIKLIVMNLEYGKLPLKDNSIDLIIANQIFEHVKEIWINHEILDV